MKMSRALPLLCVVLLVALIVVSAPSAALGQTPQVLKGFTKAIPVHNLPATGDAQKTAAMYPSLMSSNPIPLWPYSVTAYDGKTYTGQVVGLSPYNHGKTTFTLPTQVIPLVITIKDSHGTIVYDPTAPDACVPGHSGLDVITNSPLFENTNWTMNGVAMGNTQYKDAYQRAQFWTLEGGTPYHELLQESTLPGQALSFGTGGTSGPGSNFLPAKTGNCEDIGVVKTGDMDSAIMALITGPLAGQVNTGTLPLFLTKNVVMSDTDTNLFGSGCCTLGFHSSFMVGGQVQLYGPFEVDTAGAFGSGYTGVMAHEVGEGLDDPLGTNPTPPWGNQGQQANCQDNFEAGDPLSGGGIPPTSKDFVVSENGLTYNLQELAFFSWFYGGPSIGSGGLYSNNGTFTGFAKACPPGGTN